MVTSIILTLLVDFSKKVLAGNAKLTIKKIKDNATHVVSRFVIYFKLIKQQYRPI